MHKSETWQLFYPNGEPIPGGGRAAARDNPEGEDSEIVGVAVVFLYRVSRGRLEFLWQKRSEFVRNPGTWDYAAGGHINLGESLTEAAVREAREEIGVEISAEDLQLLEMVGYTKNRFGWVYLVDFSGRECDFHFDDREVSEVKWVPYDEMEEFIEKYAKKPIRKDKVTFLMLEKWLKENGNI